MVSLQVGPLRCLLWRVAHFNVYFSMQSFFSVRCGLRIEIRTGTIPMIVPSLPSFLRNHATTNFRSPTPNFALLSSKSFVRLAMYFACNSATTSFGGSATASPTSIGSPKTISCGTSNGESSPYCGQNVVVVVGGVRGGGATRGVTGG